MENGGKLKKPLTKEDTPKCEEDPLQIPQSQPPQNQVHVHRTVKSVQTSVQSVQTMTRVYEAPLDHAGPSRVASHMLTNIPPQIVSSQSHMPKFLTSHILISTPTQTPSSHSRHILQNSQLGAPQIHASSAKLQTSHVLSAPLHNSQMIPPQVPTSKHHSHILTSPPPPNSQVPTSHVSVQKNPTSHILSSSQIATVKIPTSQIITSPPPTSQMAPQLLTPHILTSPPPHVTPSPTHILPSPPVYQTQTVPYSHANVHSMQFTHNNINDATFRQHQVDLLRNAGLYADTREHCTTE